MSVLQLALLGGIAVLYVLTSRRRPTAKYRLYDADDYLKHRSQTTPTTVPANQPKKEPDVIGKDEQTAEVKAEINSSSRGMSLPAYAIRYPTPVTAEQNQEPVIRDDSRR